MAEMTHGLPEIFPFVTVMHREVVLRPKDGESEDIEMTPDEADRVAALLLSAAESARGTWCGVWYDTVHVPVGPGASTAVSFNVIQLSGNADIEIFPFNSALRRNKVPFFPPGERRVVLRHKDGLSQDMVLTPIEADQVAEQLRAAAAAARVAD